MVSESTFLEASNVFGPAEYANVLSQNLNSHVTAAQKLFGKHGLLARYQHIAQDKYDTINGVELTNVGRTNSRDRDQEGLPSGGL